jgi:hypothetical protein
MGKIFKIDGKFQLPQVIIENGLVINYNQLMVLNESGILDSMINMTQCEHVRFNGNTIAYVKPKDYFCIYCYSKKKTRKQVTIFCNHRDYTDEDNNDLIGFCEKNELKFELVDTANTRSSVFKEKTIIFNGKYDEPYRFEDFYGKVENMLVKRPKCEDCGNKLSSLENSVEKSACMSCSSSTSALRSFLTNTPIADKRAGVKRNPYNFIEKLQLNQKEYAIQQNKIKKLLEYSFNEDGEEFI